MILFYLVWWLTDQILQHAGPAHQLLSPPAQLYDGVIPLQTLMTQINGLCYWVDWDAFKSAFAVVVAAWVMGLAVRVARIVFGFFVG